MTLYEYLSRTKKVFRYSSKIYTGQKLLDYFECDEETEAFGLLEREVKTKVTYSQKRQCFVNTVLIEDEDFPGIWAKLMYEEIKNNGRDKNPGKPDTLPGTTRLGVEGGKR